MPMRPEKRKSRPPRSSPATSRLQEGRPKPRNTIVNGPPRKRRPPTQPRPSVEIVEVSSDGDESGEEEHAGGLLRGLQPKNIITARLARQPVEASEKRDDEESPAAQAVPASTRYTTRAARNGRTGANYDMKFHPMDEVTRPRSAATRRARARRDSASSLIDDESIVELSDAETSDEEFSTDGASDAQPSDEEHSADELSDREATFSDGTPEPAQRKPDPKAVRHSARAEAQKAVTYSKKHHPQDYALEGYRGRAKRAHLTITGVSPPRKRKQGSPQSISVAESQTKSAKTNKGNGTSDKRRESSARLGRGSQELLHLDPDDLSLAIASAVEHLQEDSDTSLPPVLEVLQDKSEGLLDSASRPLRSSAIASQNVSNSGQVFESESSDGGNNLVQPVDTPGGRRHRAKGDLLVMIDDEGDVVISSDALADSTINSKVPTSSTVVPRRVGLKHGVTTAANALVRHSDALQSPGKENVPGWETLKVQRAAADFHETLVFPGEPWYARDQYINKPGGRTDSAATFQRSSSIALERNASDLSLLRAFSDAARQTSPEKASPSRHLPIFEVDSCEDLLSPPRTVPPGRLRSTQRISSSHVVAAQDSRQLSSGSAGQPALHTPITGASQIAPEAAVGHFE